MGSIYRAPWLGYRHSPLKTKNRKKIKRHIPISGNIDVLGISKARYNVVDAIPRG